MQNNISDYNNQHRYQDNCFPKQTKVAAIMCFLLALLAIGSLFVPSFVFVEGDVSLSVLPTNLIGRLFQNPDFEIEIILESLLLQTGTEYLYFGDILNIGLNVIPIVILVGLVFALIFIVFGILYLAKKDFNQTKIPVLISLIYTFIVNLIVSAYCLIIMILYKMKNPDETTNLLSFFALITFVLSIILTFIIIVLHKRYFSNALYFYDASGEYYGGFGKNSEYSVFVNNDQNNNSLLQSNPKLVDGLAILPVGCKKFYGLPKNVRSIGGHAYSQNQYLQIAYIPIGIRTIGVGAFSNCMHLEKVTIPKSVRFIKANAFFNCARLKTIKYNGTKEQWKTISRGSNWLTKAGTNQVICTDGIIIVITNK